MLVLKLRCCLTDEDALVKAAAHLGFVFTTRTPETVEIEVVSFYLVFLISTRNTFNLFYMNIQWNALMVVIL